MLRRAAPIVALTVLAVGVLSHANARPHRAHPLTSRTPSVAARLELVADFPSQQVTGVAVSPTGRVFVALPRWTEDVPISVGEVVRGRIVPYPNLQWNAWRNARPAAPGLHFVCVQSVVIDPGGTALWALDAASPAQSGPVVGGPKLVKIDLRNGAVVKVIAFGPDVAIPGSYLNDVRFSPDGRWAYLTDSGVRGALVALNVETGQARRVLDGHTSTQPEDGATPRADGRELRRPDGRPLRIGADGLALSPRGDTLYWQALSGESLYSLPTAVLQDSTSAGSAATQLSRVATTHPADGLWIDGMGRLFVTNPEQDSVELAARPGAPLSVLVRDPRLRWPDSFAQGGPDSVLYVTTSHIQDSPWFNPAAKATPSQIWKIAVR